MAELRAERLQRSTPPAALAAPPERMVPANTDQEVAPGGLMASRWGGRVEVEGPSPGQWLLFESVLQGVGAVVPRLLTALYLAVARLLGS